jgi:hypothetical protein
VLLNILARELVQVRTLTQANLLGFCLGVFDFPAVAQNSPDHPKRPDTNGSSAMNKRGTVFRIVSDLQKLCDLFVFRIAESHWDVEIAQAQLFRFCFFFGCSMFTRLAQIDYCFNAFRFQFFKMLESRLAARAEVLIHTQKVSDRRRVFLRH